MDFVVVVTSDKKTDKRYRASQKKATIMSPKVTLNILFNWVDLLPATRADVGSFLGQIG